MLDDSLEFAAKAARTAHNHCWHLGCILPTVAATIVRTGARVQVRPPWVCPHTTGTSTPTRHVHPTAQHAECGDLRSHLHKSLHLACVLQVALEVYDMQGHVFQNDYDLGDSKSAAQKPPQPATF